MFDFVILTHDGETCLDFGMQGHGFHFQRHLDLVEIAERHAFAYILIGFEREVVQTQHHIL